MKEKRYIGIVDAVVFVLLLGILEYFFWRLVFCQTIYAGKDGGYFSDILAYMQEVQGIDSGYSFPYPLFFSYTRFLTRFLSIDYAISFAEVSLNSLAIILTKICFEQFLRRFTKQKDTLLRHILITIGVFSTFLMSMWWLPRFGKYHLPFKDQVFYGTYSGNPWHNATYIATRPFAIVAFCTFVMLLEILNKKPEETPKKKKIAVFAVFGVSLLLTTLAKPSFTLVFVSVAGVVLLIRLFVPKLGGWKRVFPIGLLFLPTFAVLLYQFGGVFGQGAQTEGEHGIGFGFFEVWKAANPHVLAAILYANVFSLIALCFFIKELKEEELYRFTVLFFVFAVLEAGLLYEKGFRYSHFNFSWGYMHGIFFFQMGSIMILLKEVFREKKRWPAIIIPSVFLLSQVIFGILYFRGLYCGLDYNTLLPSPWL